MAICLFLNINAKNVVNEVSFWRLPVSVHPEHAAIAVAQNFKSYYQYLHHKSKLGTPNAVMVVPIINVLMQATKNVLLLLGLGGLMLRRKR